jgi:DnaK suppressor protein
MAALKKSELKEFRKRLLVLQARVRGDVEQLKDEALERGEGSGDSRSPTHIAELGTENYEQDFALRVVENDQEVLEEIRAALKRLDDGVYGACERCLEEGKPISRRMIPKTRLRAIPHARNCVACERKREEFSL